ncbi:MAG: hypothetical protein H6835_11425 [Planctomycetes bacterium]|nr:hypothetical protein [Planctomycetota bacterium]
MTRKAKTNETAPKGGQSSLTKTGRPRPAAERSKILEHLSAEHGLATLLVLVERHPELVPDVEQIVRDLTASVSPEAIADQVVQALAALTMFDLGRNDPGDPLGYRDETETAWDVVTETIQPFVESVRRLARMGLSAAALVHCQGALLGLYRAEREKVSELMEWIPDAPVALADDPLRALAPLRQRVVPGTGASAGKLLKEFAREHLPRWKWLQK